MTHARLPAPRGCCPSRACPEGRHKPPRVSWRLEFLGSSQRQLLFRIVPRFELRWWEHADLAVEPALAEPVHVFQGCKLHVPEPAPGTTVPDRRRALHGGVGAAGRDLQDSADRLDAPTRLVGLDERHRAGKCGSNSRAKQAEAAFRIAVARRRSRFSRCSSRIRSRSAVVTPVRWCWSTSACLSHRRSASVPTSSLPAIEVIAARSEAYFC